MNRVHCVILLLIIFYAVQCVKDPVAFNPDDLAPDSVVVLDNSNFNDSISVKERVAMVEFYSWDCGHCIAMIDTVDSLSKTFRGTALIAKVEVDENDSLRQAFEVYSWPTFIFFKSGEEYDRHVGRTSFDTLAAFIQSGIDD